MPPTAHMISERLTVLNARVQMLTTMISPQEAEDLYTSMRTPTTDYSTERATKEPEMDDILEKYMHLGLSRKDAILKMAKEKGIELRPGLHFSPTMDDAYSELQEEMKQAERARRERERHETQFFLHKKNEGLYEALVQIYTIKYGDGSRRDLEDNIQSLTKYGLSREEAIYKLAEKERCIKKDYRVPHEN